MKFYTRYAKEWEKAEKKVRISDEKLSVNVYDGAVFLPLRVIHDKNFISIKRRYEGGLVSNSGNFISGFQRNRLIPNANFSVNRGYMPKEIPEFLNETVVFGGLVFNHFGHLLIDGLSRVWYAIEHPEMTVVFLSMDAEPFAFSEFLDLLAINYRIVSDVPLQCRHVIVPEESVFSLEMHANRKFLAHINKLCEIVPKTDEPKKIYCTRREFYKQDGMNEEYFEDFFADLGYEIVAPEKLSFSEQIALCKNASHLAGTLGTVTHLALFMNEGSRLDIILREPKQVIRQQLLIDKLKNHTSNYIEATRTLLPTRHADSFHLYFPTRYFFDWCNDFGYAPKKMQDEDFFKNSCYEYLCKYVANYRTEFEFKKIRHLSMYDLVNSLSLALYDKEISRTAVGAFDFAKAYSILTENKDAQKSFFSVAYYAEDVGWMCAENALFFKNPVLAVKTDSKLPVLFGIYTYATGWMFGETGNTLGFFENNEAVRNVFFTCKDEKYVAVYRVYTENGWSNFCDNGQFALDCYSLQCFGLQVFLERKK